MSVNDKAAAARFLGRAPNRSALRVLKMQGDVPGIVQSKCAPGLCEEVNLMRQRCSVAGSTPTHDGRTPFAHNSDTPKGAHTLSYHGRFLMLGLARVRDHDRPNDGDRDWRFPYLVRPWSFDRANQIRGSQARRKPDTRPESGFW